MEQAPSTRPRPTTPRKAAAPPRRPRPSAEALSTFSDPVATPGERRGVLIGLCTTVTVSYGVLYYAFAILAPSISSDTGWSVPSLTAAFSAGSVLGALLGVGIGRTLQQHGPRLVMTLGSILGAAGLMVLVTAASYPVFVTGWLLIGAATSGAYYPPAFAALTHWFGAHRVRAITSLTLVAGFASTIFAPLTAALDERWGWRITYAIYAAALLLLAAPLHAVTLRPAWSTDRTSRSVPDRHILRSVEFITVTCGATLASLAMYASIVLLVPLLLNRGLTPQAAAWVLGTSGAGQVAGRLLYPPLSRRLGVDARTTLVLAVMAITIVALSVTPPHLPAMLIVAFFAGAARGVFTLVSATSVSDRWSPGRYAALNGVYQAPLGLAAALAPAAGGVLVVATGSYSTLFVTLGLITLVGAVPTVARSVVSRRLERRAEFRQ